MEDVEFRDQVTFYEFVSKNPHLREYEAVAHFCNSFEQINIGCGCQKKARIGRAQRFFLSLAPELSMEQKVEIKNSAGGGVVSFFDASGGLFMRI